MNAETGDWSTTTIEKNMFGRWALTDQRDERLDCVAPERTVTLLASFADDSHAE
jgi:hypothetical protein